MEKNDIICYANAGGVYPSEVEDIHKFFDLTDDAGIRYAVSVLSIDDYGSSVWVRASYPSRDACLVAYVGVTELYHIHIGCSVIINAPCTERQSNYALLLALTEYWGAEVYTDGEHLFKEGILPGKWYKELLVNMYVEGFLHGTNNIIRIGA